MKNISILIICVVIANAIYAQSPDWLWAKQIGGTSHDLVFSMILDDSSNIYTTGYFQGTSDFDPGPGTFNLNAVSGNDGFVTKSDSAGHFVWAKVLGGTGSEIGEGIVTDDSGNVYITGMFSGTTDFDPGAGVFNLVSTGSNDVFICKLDNAGNFVWARAMGGTDDDTGWAMSIDDSSNIYISGHFSLIADFDPGTGIYNLTSAGAEDIFVCKLNSSGNFIWAKRMGATGEDIAHAIAVDIYGNTYSYGYFQGVVDFDPGAATFSLTSIGSYSFFICKLDSSGNFVWARATGGSDAFVYYSIALDDYGNVYTTGNFLGTVDFDPGPGIYNLSSVGDWDIFVSKLDNAGNFNWAKRMGSSSYESGISITIGAEGNGNVYTTGFFRGTVDFNPGTGTYNLTDTGNGDIFLLKLDSAGNFIWVMAMPGPEIDLAQCITLNSDGNLYMSGGFGTTISFSSTLLTNFNIGSSTWDTFIAKLDGETVNTGINNASFESHLTNIFPNPLSSSATISFFLLQPEIVLLKLTDMNGRLIHTIAEDKFGPGEISINWNAAAIEPGIYLLQMKTGSHSYTEKISIVR